MTTHSTVHECVVGMLLTHIDDTYFEEGWQFAKACSLCEEDGGGPSPSRWYSHSLNQMLFISGTGVPGAGADSCSWTSPLG